MLGPLSVKWLKYWPLLFSHDISYHSPWKWSYLQQQWSCHMCLVVASCCRGACFPLSQPLSPPFPPAVTPLPPPPSTCSRSSGWVWAGLLQTRALCHPAPPSLSPSHHLQQHHLSPRSLSAYFPFVRPILLVAVWFTGAWETCDHSAGYQELQAASVFGGGERRNKENNLTQLAYYQDIQFDLRTCIFCQRTLTTLNRNESHIKQMCTICDSHYLGKLPLLAPLFSLSF